MNPQQSANIQQVVQQKIRKECENIYFMLDEERTKKWYDYAIQALAFASPLSLNLSQPEYLKLLEIVDNGVNLNTVATLCNNLEMTTPDQLNITLAEYQYLIKLNMECGNNWRKAVLPMQEKLMQEEQTKLKIANAGKGGRILKH